MSRKRPKKAPRRPKFCVDWLATATNQEQAISLATWLKMRFQGHPIHPQSPTVCCFHPSELPKRTPTAPYLGPPDCGKLQAQTETGGGPNGSSGSNRGRKLSFLKNDPRPCVMLKQVFLAKFGPPKIPKCLENGLSWVQVIPFTTKPTFKAFLDFCGAQNAPQNGLKMGSFHPLVYPKWSTMSFGKMRFLPIFDPFLVKLSPLCQRPSMCDSLVSLTIHSRRQPQTKNGPYLWLHGSKRDSKGTQSTRTPPLFVVSTHQNCPNGHLHPRT